MKKEVVVCDFEDGKCRHLADSACCICNKDGCDTHLPHTMEVQFLVKTNRELVHDVIVTKRQMCFLCYDSLKASDMPSISDPELFEAANDILQRAAHHIRAHLTEEKLKKGGAQ